MRYWSGAVAVGFVILVTVCIRLIVAPRSLPIIDLSAIAHADQAGVLGFRGLQDVIASSELIIFALHPDVKDGDAVVAGIFKAMTAARVPFAQWNGQVPMIDIGQNISTGKKSVVVLPQVMVTGEIRKKFEADAKEFAGQEPLVIFVVPIETSVQVCPEQRVVYNVYDQKFVPCSSMALQGRRFRKGYTPSGHFMALSGFGRRTYVLFVQ